MTPERVKEEVKSILRRLNLIENRKLNFTSETRAFDVISDVTFVSCPFGNVTARLPSAFSKLGSNYILKKTDNINTVTIQADGSETIDGSNTYPLTTQYQVVNLFSDGTEWHIIGT